MIGGWGDSIGGQEVLDGENKGLNDIKEISFCPQSGGEIVRNFRSEQIDRVAFKKYTYEGAVSSRPSHQ